MKWNLIIFFSMLLSFAVRAQTTDTALIRDKETRHDPSLVGSKFQNDFNTTSDLTKNDTPKIGRNRISIFENAPTFNKTRFYGVASLTLTALVGSYIYVNNAWWTGQKSSFHFDGGTGLKHVFTFGRDVKYAKNLDKLGHFYGGRIGGDLFSEAVRWSGKSENSAYVWGGVFSSSIQFFIEIKDGFSPDWGFSIYDFMAGSFGSFYPYFQSKSKFLKALDHKFSYWRTDDYYYKIVKHASGFQDDYMNQTYWFTFNPKRFKLQSKWPKWLGISVGVGVDNKLNDYYTGIITDHSVLGKGGYEFFIAPDIDFTGLLPKTQFWQRAAKFMNYIKFPAPTLRLSNNSRFFPVYF